LRFEAQAPDNKALMPARSFTRICTSQMLGGTVPRQTQLARGILLACGQQGASCMAIPNAEEGFWPRYLNSESRLSGLDSVFIPSSHVGQISMELRCCHRVPDARLITI
jgi:hypothetical protein